MVEAHIPLRGQVAVGVPAQREVERFGKPRIVRSDNEATFRSRLFRFVLRALGIRPQLTPPFAPWQNGRIERFFGAAKPILRARFGDRSAQPITQKDLALVRTW